MKSIISLRFFSLFGFLVLIAPFYDQCNGRGMKQAEVKATEAIDSTAFVIEESINEFSVDNEIEDTIDIKEKSENEIPIYQKIYEFIDDEETQNAFELANGVFYFSKMTKDEFMNELADDKKNNKYDTIAYIIIAVSFATIVFSTLLIVLLSFSKKIKWILTFLILNLILILIATGSIIFFDSMFETFSQMKWGYYTFIIIQIVLLYFQNKIDKEFE